MVCAKYSGYTFYVHNLGGYDIYFMLKLLANSDMYKLYILSRNGSILSLRIQNKHTGHSIKLIDSYNILSHKLKDLCSTFSTEVNKDIFPYEFMNKYTLFYKGPKPDFSYYNKYISLTEYNELPMT
jgi:hypothetical protein